MADSDRNDSGSFENMGRKVDEHLGDLPNRLEDDVRRVIAYLNDRVVPEVRQNSSATLRVAAEQLSRLAEALDSRNRQAHAPSSGTEPRSQQ